MPASFLNVCLSLTSEPVMLNWVFPGCEPLSLSYLTLMPSHSGCWLLPQVLRIHSFLKTKLLQISSSNFFVLCEAHHYPRFTIISIQCKRNCIKLPGSRQRVQKAKTSLARNKAFLLGGDKAAFSSIFVDIIPSLEQCSQLRLSKYFFYLLPKLSDSKKWYP
jgi:hypothetical protein